MKKLLFAMVVWSVVCLGFYGFSFAQGGPQARTGLCPCVSSMNPIKVSGKIESLSFPTAILKTSKGETYTLRLGPWWFWKEKGYTLEEGENVEVEGFQTANVIVPSVIKASSGDIILRDANGWPLWGGGRGGKGSRGGRWQ